MTSDACFWPKITTDAASTTFHDNNRSGKTTINSETHQTNVRTSAFVVMKTREMFASGALWWAQLPT